MGSAPKIWSTLPGRLRWAVGRLSGPGRKRGIRQFQRQLAAMKSELNDRGEDLPGVHMASVAAYLDGTSQPKPPWIRAAAKILGVRLEWLVAGEGQPTEEEEEHADIVGISLAEIEARKEAGTWTEAEERAFEKATAGVRTNLRSLFAGIQQTCRSEFMSGVTEVFPAFYDLPDAARAAVNGTSGLMMDVNRDGLDSLHYTDALRELGRRLGRYLSDGFELLHGAPLGPVEKALVVDSLLRPLSIASHASRIAELIPQEESDDAS